MTSRIPQLDLIRAIAILLVICIHSQGLLQQAVIDEVDSFGVMHVSDALWQFVYIAVPLFVMLNGSLLIGRDEPLKDFFLRRFKRVIVPFVVWSIIVGILSYYKEHHTLYGCIFWLVTNFVTGGVHKIYWFVYLILGIYLLIPLLRQVVRNRNIELYSVVFFFVIYVMSQLLPEVSITNRFMNKNLVYVICFVFGHLVLSNKNFFLQHRLEALGIFAISIVIGFIDKLLWNEWAFLEPIIAVESSALFALLVVTPMKDIMLKSWVCGGGEFLSEMSYGIYLTHYFMFISVLISLPWIRTNYRLFFLSSQSQ